MNNLDLVDQFMLIIVFICVPLNIFTAWENLANKRISFFGFDAILIWIIKLFTTQSRVEQLRKDPKAIKRMGVMMILMALGGISELALIIKKVS